jgi:hypothetical protein
MESNFERQENEAQPPSQQSQARTNMPLREQISPLQQSSVLVCLFIAFCFE